MDKFKLLWCSDNPLGITGYGTVTRNVIKRLAKLPCWDIQVQSSNAPYWGKPAWIVHREGEEPAIIRSDEKPENAYKIFPIKTMKNHYDLFARRSLKERVLDFKPDITLTLNDTFMHKWVLEDNWNPAPSKLMFYYPSDGYPLPQGVGELLKRCHTPVAMSKDGQKQGMDQLEIDVEYIPHGVDTEVFKPLSKKEKMDARIEWSKRLKYDLTDKFIFGSVFRNQGRKAPQRGLKAMKRFYDKYGWDSNVIFLLHTDAHDPAGNPGYFNLIRRYGLNEKIVFTGMAFETGLSEEELARLYSVMDSHFLSTTGEGFGLPTLEAAACGVPSVVTDFTTTNELVRGRGIPVPYITTVTGSHNVERAMVDVEAMADAFHEMSSRDEQRRRWSKGCVEFAQDYDWEKIVPQWDKLLRRVIKNG